MGQHTNISKMLQEIRQRCYYPSMAKHVKKWIDGCEQCARDKRVPNTTITPELLNLPEWDLGPEDAMQIDLLPNLPPNGGYENLSTAIDVFSRYLFAYPLTTASAINVAKALIDIMTKHAYLPTTLITDKGTAFTSTIIAEITQTRTLASLKTNLKMACGEYRRQWHRYLDTTIPAHERIATAADPDPITRLANVLTTMQNRPTAQQLTIRPVNSNTMTFDGKSEKFELFEDLFHTMIKMQPEMTEQMKINHFHSLLRKIALQTFRNINSTNRQTLEDVLVNFRRKYVKPEWQATAKHKWHRLVFHPNTMKLPDFLEELNQGAEKAFGDHAQKMIDSLLYAKLLPKL